MRNVIDVVVVVDPHALQALMTNVTLVGKEDISPVTVKAVDATVGVVVVVVVMVLVHMEVVVAEDEATMESIPGPAPESAVTVHAELIVAGLAAEAESPVIAVTALASILIEAGLVAVAEAGHTLPNTTTVAAHLIGTRTRDDPSCRHADLFVWA